MQTVLVVTVLPSFAVRWLLPRLPAFRRQNPGIEVEVLAQHTAVDFRRERVDVALRYSHDLARPACRTLPGRRRVPGVRPAAGRGEPALRRPGICATRTLIHDVLTGDDEPWVTWQQWLLHFGLDDVDVRRGPRYSDSHMML